MAEPITLTPFSECRHLLRDTELKIYTNTGKYVFFEVTDALSGINFVNFKLEGKDLVKLKDCLNQMV